MSNALLLIVVVLCVTVGFILGALILLLVTRKEKGSQEAPHPAPGSPPQPAAAAPQGVRLLSDPATGKLMVELSGRPTASASSLNEDQRKTLEKAYGDLGEWLGKQPPLPVQPLQRPAEQPPAALPLVTPPPAQEPASRPSGLRARLANTKDALPGNMPPAVEPVPATLFQPAKPNPEAAHPAPTMVMQIDEILQEMAAQSPLANRGIRITEEPRQGVVVWIATTRYQGIDSVPDPDARALIRAAVAEWERRSEAGQA